MSRYSLIGRRRLSAFVRRSACVHCFTASVLAFFIRFFVKILVERNANISNGLNFSDVYRRVNYIGSLAKFTWGSFTLHVTQCNLHFD